MPGSEGWQNHYDQQRISLRTSGVYTVEKGTVLLYALEQKASNQASQGDTHSLFFVGTRTGSGYRMFNKHESSRDHAIFAVGPRREVYLLDSGSGMNGGQGASTGTFLDAIADDDHRLKGSLIKLTEKEGLVGMMGIEAAGNRPAHCRFVVGYTLL